jgi:hypothetical protein
MRHLNSDELIDAMDGMLTVDRRAHLTTCEQCERELAQLSSVLSDTKQVSVPEPSPLFWTHFSERVRTAIDDDTAPGANWPSWLRWQVLLPIGAVAAIILSLMISVPKQDPRDSEFVLHAPEAPQAPDERWTMVADLIGDLNIETAAEAGVLVRPGVADQAVLELTADEQQELTRLLKVELTRVKS